MVRYLCLSNAESIELFESTGLRTWPVWKTFSPSA
jgi:hypothetical protein